MTIELDWWERKQRQRHEDERDATRPLTFRCLVCKNITFSPTGIGLPCVVCRTWTRMEVIGQ